MERQTHMCNFTPQIRGRCSATYIMQISYFPLHQGNIMMLPSPPGQDFSPPGQGHDATLEGGLPFL